LRDIAENSVILHQKVHCKLHAQGTRAHLAKAKLGSARRNRLSIALSFALEAVFRLARLGERNGVKDRWRPTRRKS
jgi:hypothetical protein